MKKELQQQTRYEVRREITIKDGDSYRPMTVLPRFLDKLYDYSVYQRSRKSAF